MSGAGFDKLTNRGGMGLKPAHSIDVLAACEAGAGPSWVEVHPQNYAMDGGPMHASLTAIADRLPISFHSVGLSLGDPGGCDRDELGRLAVLVDRYQPAMVSDHLSWSSLDGEKFPDLLPVPMTRAALDHFCIEVSRVQDTLGRAMLIENPSRLLAYQDDAFDEPDFLMELCRRTGCGLLLDLNNIIVTTTNLGGDPGAWLDAIDHSTVGEIHVAGHSVEDHGDGLLVAIDDHGSAVGEQCWTSLDDFVRRAGPRPVLVERDNDVPSFGELMAEVARADRVLERELADAS